MTSDQLVTLKCKKSFETTSECKSKFKNVAKLKTSLDYFLMITDDDSEPLQNIIFYSTSNFYTNVACYGMKLGFSVFFQRDLIKNLMKKN